MQHERILSQSDYEIATPEVVIQGLVQAIEMKNQDLDTERERANTEHHNATHDELTGVLNPRGIKELLDAFDEAGIEVFVLFTDGDRFGNINKKHGHAVGNKAIVGMANVLSMSVRTTEDGSDRPMDYVGRLGGDEFVVFGAAKSMTEQDMDNLRDRIQYNINQYTNDNPELSELGISSGGAIGEPGTLSEAVMLLADVQMQTHKAIERSEAA